ncbi:MAG: sensor histidine kinase, partial [Candidatus Limnocylindria bacterium]
AQDTASSGHRIEVDAPERLEGEWDPDRLAQAVANLLSNAIRYSPNGGVIQVGVGQADGQVVVRVTDEGLGLTAEEIETIFSAFARASAAKEVPGTGLGLYITSGIIHAHGGQIWAESPGRGLGATFRFSLPTWGTDRDPAVRDAFLGKGPHP